MAQTLGSEALAPKVDVSDHVFNKGIGAHISCEVWDNDAHTGGNDPPIHFIQDQMMVRILNDLRPGLRQVIGGLRNGFLMQAQI